MLVCRARPHKYYRYWKYANKSKSKHSHHFFLGVSKRKGISESKRKLLTKKKRTVTEYRQHKTKNATEIKHIQVLSITTTQRHGNFFGCKSFLMDIRLQHPYRHKLAVEHFDTCVFFTAHTGPTRITEQARIHWNATQRQEKDKNNRQTRRTFNTSFCWFFIQSMWAQTKRSMRLFLLFSCAHMGWYVGVHALFLATRLMQVHHIPSILWELELIDIQFSSAYLSMPRRQSMWLVFQFARLVTCVAPRVVGLFLANVQCAFPRSADSNSIKNIQRKSPGGTMLFIVQNKESTWCASLFRSKYSGIGDIHVLVSRMYHRICKVCKNNSLPPCCQGENKGNLFTFSTLGVLFMCNISHLTTIWPLDPHEKLLIDLLQYNRWWKFVGDMTLFWHHLSLIVELLVHRSHIQSTLHVHQSECMKNTTKHYLTHSKLAVSLTPLIMFAPQAKFWGKSAQDHRRIGKPGRWTHYSWSKIIVWKFCSLVHTYIYRFIYE